MGHWSVKMESNMQAMLERIEKQSVSTPLVISVVLENPDRNKKIADIQRLLYKRDPFYVSAAEAKKMQTVLTDAISTSGDRLDRATIMRAAAYSIGRELALLDRAHIDAGKTTTNKEMPELQPSTLRRKKRKGRDKNPILVDTGEFRQSINFRVESAK